MADTIGVSDTHATTSDGLDTRGREAWNGKTEAFMKLLLWIVMIVVAAFLAPFIWTMLTVH